MAIAPLVSVIIPAYNAERFLPDALASVLRQTWSRLEAIVVNDGSSDGTSVLADHLAAADQRVRVIHKKNGGLSSARNAGIKAAAGDFLCFLDADDILLPDKIERQLSFLQRTPSCDLVYSDHYLGDEKLTPVSLECKRPPSIPMRELLAYRTWFASMSPLMRSDFQRRVGLFDEGLMACEDWDFWNRASWCGVFGYLPGPVAVYRTHSDQMHNSWQRMVDAKACVIRKLYQPGSREWRIANADTAWSEAKRSWAGGRYGRTFSRLSVCLWYARSPGILRNVVSLSV